MRGWFETMEEKDDGSDMVLSIRLGVRLGRLDGKSSWCGDWQVRMMYSRRKFGVIDDILTRLDSLENI